MSHNKLRHIQIIAPGDAAVIFNWQISKYQVIDIPSIQSNYPHVNPTDD